MAGGRQTSASPQRTPCALVLSLSQPAPLSPVFPSPLLSFCLQPLRGAKQLVPRLGGPALRFPGPLAGVPLPYPLPALARSPPAPHIHTAAGRGGREGARAADGSDRVDLVLARNSGKTQPAGVLPPLSNYSSALRSRTPSPAFGPSPGTSAVALSLPAGLPGICSCAPPLSCTQLPFGCPPLATACPLPPQPPMSRWRWQWRVAPGRSGARRHCRPPPQPGQAAGSRPG